MPEPVNTYRYLSYLGSRWRFIAVTCLIAVSVTLGVDLARTKQYTATCRILIEPPASTDSRTVLGISPVYLESLKTYEQFAGSDSLFLSALEQFHLRQEFPNGRIESLKKRILKVGMVRDTKIMEIDVTLPDPNTAHALAKYLGEAAVNLSRQVERGAEEELTETAEKQAAAARTRLDRSEAAWMRLATQHPVEALEQETKNGEAVATSLEQQLLGAEADASDPQEVYSAGARARAQTLRKQLAEVRRNLAAQEALLARRTAERDRAKAERTDSLANYSAMEKRLNQVRSDPGYRNERLTVIDGGIVPEQPSAPNIPLHIFAALLLGLAAPLIYLTMELSYRTQRAGEMGRDD